METIAHVIEERNHQEEVVLIHKESAQQFRYVQTLLEQIDAVGKQTEYYPNGSVKRLVLDSAKIKRHNLFFVNEAQRKDPVASLALVESILRRKLIGIRFEEVEIEQVY